MSYEDIRSSVLPDYSSSTGNSADEAFSMNDEVTVKRIDTEIGIVIDGGSPVHGQFWQVEAIQIVGYAHIYRFVLDYACSIMDSRGTRRAH